MFAGAGGTTLGLKQAGFDVRVAVELDPYKANSLQLNHSRSYVLGANGTSGDIRGIEGKQLLTIGNIPKGKLDLLVGCPPCQGFSLQGKRDPTDKRNSLYREFTRLIDEIKPKSIVFENVPGFINFQEGEIYQDLQDRIENLDYYVQTWILDAKFYGVPQSRTRVFLVGMKGNDQPTKPNRCKKIINVWPAIADIPSRFITSDKSAVTVSIPYLISPQSKFAARMKGNRSKVRNCEVTSHCKPLLKRLKKLKWNERDEPTWHRKLHPNEPAFTITAGARTRTACRPIHPFKDRVLTVREGARLASFPDWYKFPGHKAEAWSQIGNCVPPILAKKVFNRVRVCL